MTTTADVFIDQVLNQMPQSTPRRQQIALELRGHIAERMAAGQSLDEVLRQLGDPRALAESYLSAVPLVPGSFWARAVARVFDFFITVVALAPFAFMIWLVSDPWIFPIWLIAYIIAGSVLIAAYPIVAEVQFGKTWGKHLMGLRVVRESGARIGIGQSIVRQLPVFLQVFWIDALFALFTDKRQRAFELLSKTRVVKS